AKLTFARIVLVHLAILGGFAILAGFEVIRTQGGAAFFLPFAALKLLVDLASALGSSSNPRPDPPRWMVSLINRFKPGTDFAAYCAAERAKEEAQEAEDEMVLESADPKKKKKHKQATREK